MSTLQIPRRIPANKMSYDNSVPLMGYAGASKEELAQGFRESLVNELDFLDLNEQEYSALLVEQCDRLVRHFLSETWSIWASLHTERHADERAEDMKADTKDIISFVEEAVPYLVIDDDSGFICNYAYSASNAAGETSDCANNVCMNCPRYVSRQFYLCPINIIENEILVNPHFFRIRFRPYRYLWLATLKIYQFIMKYYNEERSNVAYNTILMLPASIGKLYEMTNPVGELLETLADEKIKQLESDPEPRSEKEWSYFLQIWKEVYHDITETNLRYVENWRRCLKRLSIRHFEEKDFFLSPKSSSYHIHGLQTRRRNGRKLDTRKQSSYFVSMAEHDPIKSDAVVVKFDDDIQYHSAYNERPDENLRGDWSHYTYVLNKGKRKLRGIRLECNSVQDRCQYLEDIEKEWQDPIDYNGRRDQSIGYILGERATRTWSEFKSGNRVDFENWPSLYNTDFTDATDTVNQTVLRLYNETIYGSTIADFWMYICQKKFTFKIPGTQETKPCEPRVGNPQGCKKSFTDFNGLHLYLMAMVFKILAHLKKENPDIFEHSIDYLRTPISWAAAILGDDNGFWSIKADPNINSDIFPFYDESMGNDGAMYQVYCWLCKMCNWYLNPSKAQITTPDSKFAVWEFAKVTVVDGHTMTAPPFRMVGYMKSRHVSHPIVKPLAFALWRMKTLHDHADIFTEKILQKYSDSEEMYNFLYKMIFGGFVKIPERYIRTDILSDLDHALIITALIRAEIKVGLISQILSESECDDSRKLSLSLDTLLWNGFDENLYNKLEHPDHKFNLLLNKHLALVDMARTIKDLSSVDDKLLEAFCTVTAIRNGYNENIDHALTVLIRAREIQESLDSGLVFVDDFINITQSIDERALRDLQSFTGNLITRGTDKRPSVESAIGIEAWKEYVHLLEYLAPYERPETQNEALPDITRVAP